MSLVMQFVPISAFAYLPIYVEETVLEKERCHILELETTCNTRDLGGYKTLSGKVTKRQVFLRSDDTDELTENDIEVLKSYGVKTVIDMRDRNSVEKWPDRFNNVEYVTYHQINISEAHRDSSSGYASYLECAKKENYIKKLFDIISETEEGVILFHCVGGKDRTGILSLLLLGLAGVDTESIIENYIVSYDLIKDRPKIKDIIEKDIEELGDSCLATLHYSSKENIILAIDYIFKNYGTCENYLLACGITKESLGKIKDKFLE